MGKRQRRREREQTAPEQERLPENPERQDVTVTPGVASASGGNPAPEEIKD